MTAPAVTTPQTPGRRGLPLIGETIPFLRDQQKWARERYDRFGPVSEAHLIGRRWHVLLGPEALDVAIVDRDKAFEAGPAWGYINGAFFRGGLAYLDAEAHFRQRRIMGGAFTRTHLLSYLDGINETIAEQIDGWAGQPETRVYPAMKQLTLAIASRTFAGIRLGADAARVNDAFTDCLRASTAFVRRPVPGLSWSRGLRARRVLEQTLRAQIPARRAEPGDDFLSVLCGARDDEGNVFTDDQVVCHMIALLQAAHDTTTSTVTSMMYRLVQRPDWQERCRAESRALGTAGLTFDQLDRLPSTDLVMKETLRIDAPVPALPRVAVADTEVLGHRLPRGSFVLALPQFTHHMPEWWDEPERFDPLRFTAERREDKVHKQAWSPFGAGLHKCIGQHFAGMQIKAIMHQVLNRFAWSTDEGYEVSWDRTTVPRPKDGLRVRLVAAGRPGTAAAPGAEGTA
ncbi:cytochrome P450 [Actinacidiphila sp. bgisy144]|uniref:cytochrome P450 n=1 Tax=unclassified Actinacidiphila TaxID=2995708 RepID=UPI003EBC14E8